MDKAKKITLAFYLGRVKEFYDLLTDKESVTIVITETSVLLEEENLCGSTMLRYSLINRDLDGMVGYLDIEVLSDFIYFTGCIESATPYGITIEQINIHLKEKK